MVYPSARNKKNIMSIATLLFLSFTALYIHGSFYKVIGYSDIKYKRMENDNYYIFVRNGNKDIKLECNKDDYEKITVDSNLSYGISYKWSTLSPNKGKLLDISFNDIIDNRT
jgi:hypothetical protein